MRMQLRLPASCAPLMLPWKPLPSALKRVNWATILALHTSPLSTGFTEMKVGKPMMQIWYGSSWLSRHTQEQFRLDVFEYRESTIFSPFPTDTAYVTLDVVRCSSMGSLSGEAMLCQR
jgi:hypothetical protein